MAQQLNGKVEIALHKSRVEKSAAQRAGEILWASEEQLRILLESLSDHAVFMLDLKGRMASGNAGAERITYFPDEQVD